MTFEKFGSSLSHVLSPLMWETLAMDSRYGNEAEVSNSSPDRISMSSHLSCTRHFQEGVVCGLGAQLSGLLRLGV